ncbi:hypothetical protein GCM10018980_71780 [Streptomyces capoamus]|uniref:Restriction endonuclease type IV Mrr domain-containing protein n=1 Tax=Streptomyces capoamus TaxID=68183 RepID=A0A919F3G3_9ACTN|nr:hypothetical protein GCM10010501_16420 [Streptomyces libani subsp. rufus]GHG74733.1 hypothetical protein GCM10018980_71780 [Streptomyces capoamus]
MAGAGGVPGAGVADGRGRRLVLGAYVVGYLAHGRKLVIQCKKYAAHRSVCSPDMQKFVGTARLEHGAEVALFVTICRAFTRDALGLALRQGIVAMHPISRCAIAAPLYSKSTGQADQARCCSTLFVRVDLSCGHSPQLGRDGHAWSCGGRFRSGWAPPRIAPRAVGAPVAPPCV